MRFSALLVPALALAPLALTAADASQLVESFDSAFNYQLKFSDMPEPRPAVVHSRVERLVDRRWLWIFPLPPTNREWEFELVATPSWVEVLKRGFLPGDWDDVESRAHLPDRH